jgi:hypothetical protein
MIVEAPVKRGMLVACTVTVRTFGTTAVTTLGTFVTATMSTAVLGGDIASTPPFACTRQ